MESKRTIDNCQKRKDNRVILLTGAGASQGLGYPTFDELRRFVANENGEIGFIIQNASIELESQINRSAEYEASIIMLREYERINRVLKTDRVLGNMYKPIPGIREGEIEDKLKQAMEKCYRVLWEQYGPHRIDRKGKAFAALPIMFEQMASRNHGVLDIYTTNYDCSYQVLASSCDNVSFYSHIDNQTGEFNEGCWYNPNIDICNEGIPKIYIHRLHGCVAWVNANRLDENGVFYERFGAGTTDIAAHAINDATLDNMCIKLIASQPILGTNRVFTSAYEEFSEQLEKIDILLVWGYSFRDPEITRTINSVLLVRRDRPFRIHYIDPFLSEAAALHNIQLTLRAASTLRAEAFTPKWVDWIPGDGRESLINKIITIIEEV